MAKNPVRPLINVMEEGAAAMDGKASSSELFRRLSGLGKASSGTVKQTMNKWVREGKTVKKYEIERFIRLLRKYKRHGQAIELMDWMESQGTNLSYSNFAVRLDLLSKAEGNSAAEEYFESLPEPAKNLSTYGALLNCFCHAKNTDKALALRKKMKELNIAFNHLAYNNLMAMYMRLGQPEKIPPLFHEMKDKEVAPDAFTYNLVMQSYSMLKDIEAAEKVLDEMKEDGKVSCDWTTHSNVAAIYVAAGDFEKADAALKHLEEIINSHKIRDRQAYHFLISLYANTGNLAGVKRTFASLQSAFPWTRNLSYLVMVQSLAKLDDFDGLRQCFQEWESGRVSYDVRLANVLIGAYLRRDMKEEANLLYEDIVANGGPNFRTLEMFIDFHLKNNQIDSGLKYFELATEKTEGREWQPSREKVRIFLKHFEESKDIEGAKNFHRKLKKLKYVDLEVYTAFLRTYVAAGQTEPAMRQQIEEDQIEMNPEAEDLLQIVCPK